MVGPTRRHQPANRGVSGRDGDERAGDREIRTPSLCAPVDARSFRGSAPPMSRQSGRFGDGKPLLRFAIVRIWHRLLPLTSSRLEADRTAAPFTSRTARSSVSEPADAETRRAGGPGASLDMRRESRQVARRRDRRLTLEATEILPFVVKGPIRNNRSHWDHFSPRGQGVRVSKCSEQTRHAQGSCSANSREASFAFMPARVLENRIDA